MSRNIAPLFALPALLAIASCGGTANRQLLSLSVSPATGTGASVTYTATATYTSSPVTVTPAMVSWYIMGPAIDPPGPGYSLVNGSYVANRCSQIPGPTPETYTVIALAPMALNAPNSGSMSSQVFSDLVIHHTTTEEGGFVAATAHLTCQ